MAMSTAVLVGCLGAESGAADRGVDAFHTEMNAGNYRDIYIAASAEFRRATPESNWMDLLSAVGRKLGKVVEATRTSVHVTTGTFGTTVSQTYSTRFTDGTATESFNWAIRDGKAVLVGYRIESQQLITR